MTEGNLGKEGWWSRARGKVAGQRWMRQSSCASVGVEVVSCPQPRLYASALIPERGKQCIQPRFLPAACLGELGASLGLGWGKRGGSVREHRQGEEKAVARFLEQRIAAGKLIEGQRAT